MYTFSLDKSRIIQNREEIVVRREGAVFRCATITDFDSKEWKVIFEDGVRFSPAQLFGMIEEFEKWRSIKHPAS